MRERTQDRELRSFVSKLAVRAAEEEDSGPGTLEGYAAVFGEETDLGWYRESFAKGAFADSLKEDDQRALVDHETAKVIGRTAAGTLRLSEDDKGLKCEIDLPDTTYAADLRKCVERGDVDGMSIGFIVQKEERTAREEGEDNDLWTVTKAKLLEVSAVTFPAYEGTSISARSKERREAAAKDLTPPRADRAMLKRQEQRLRLLKLKAAEGESSA